jgi:hypothetical protein
LGPQIAIGIARKWEANIATSVGQAWKKKYKEEDKIKRRRKAQAFAGRSARASDNEHNRNGGTLQFEGTADEDFADVSEFGRHINAERSVL